MNTVLTSPPPQLCIDPPLSNELLAELCDTCSRGYSIHLKGPSGTGKTTLALHLADLLARPIMLLFGDDEFKNIRSDRQSVGLHPQKKW